MVTDPHEVTANRHSDRYLRQYKVSATGDGVEWVTQNPENAVLRYLAGRGLRGARCWDVVRDTVADMATVAGLHQQGLVVVTDRDGGAPANLGAVSGTSSWSVALTAAGRRIAISQ